MTPAGFYFDPQTLTGLKQAGEQQQTLERVAQQFEALFVHMLLKQMRQASFGDGLSDSSQSTFYRDMFDAQMAQHVGGKAGLGIAQLLVSALGKTMPVMSAGEQQDSVRPAPSPAPSATATIPRPLAELHQTAVAGAQKETLWPAVAGIHATQPSLGIPPGDIPMLRLQGLVHSPTAQPAEVAPPPAQAARMGQEPAASDASVDWQSPQEFLAHLRPFARQAAQQLGVASEVLLAQATLETGWGRKLPRHPDGRSSFNLFGIKADARWAGEWVSKPTLEFTQGGMRRVRAQFRAYASPHESFQDYASFLKTSPRYAGALDVAGDPTAYLHALQNAGYATDPHYAEKILSLLDSEQFRSALPQAAAKESSDGAV
ncbi:MAG: glucosaminidase domain-containing protein [Gammaproteobacteria bacterium]|nr:glucosaminidase domain-containing protein [Gammaproteobacteria bacterium]